MSQKMQSILVAVDGSAQSDKAVDYAVDMAAKFSSKIVLLCVYRHHSMVEASLSMVRPADPEPLDKALGDYAKEIVSAAKKRAQEGGAQDVAAFVKRGQPARTIVSFAEEHDVDTIVMGARGTGDVESFLLGSVSHKVSGLSPVTCILVK